MLDFEKLNQEVANAQLGRAKMTDAKVGHIYSFAEGDNGNVALVSDKKHRIPSISYASIAALRLVDDEKVVADLKDTKTARTNESVKTLQYAKANDGIVLSADLKLKVAGKIKINDSVNGGHVYNNDCYKEYRAYLDRCTEINEQTPAAPGNKVITDKRNAEFQKATNALRASGLRDGFTPTENDMQKMPVFIIAV